MKSSSANDGSYSLTVTFALGTDPDINTVNVQNRVNLAEPQLPEEVKRQGLNVKKKSTAMLQVVALFSPKGAYDSLFLSNYATINVVDTLARVNGVGEVYLCGPTRTARRCGSRTWPGRARLQAVRLRQPAERRHHCGHGHRSCAGRQCRGGRRRRQGGDGLLAERFPDDMDYAAIYDTTDFVKASLEKVIHTLLDAFVLVIIVVFLSGYPLGTDQPAGAGGRRRCRVCDRLAVSGHAHRLSA